MAENIQLQVNQVGSLFQKTFTINKQDNNILTLNTTNTFIDKDIQLTYNVRSASIHMSAPASASITSIGGFTYNNNTFSLTGSANITGTAHSIVNTSGWITNDLSCDITGTASLSGITLPEIQLTTSITGTAKVTPTIIRTDTTGSGTAINVGNDLATATAPSNGYFISMQSQAAENTITATPVVSTAGYGTVAHSQKTNTILNVGANDSSIFYIPITTGIATADTASADVTLSTIDGTNAGINISEVVGTKTTTEPTSGYYIAMTPSGSGNSKVTTAGWFPTGALATASTTADTKYFPIQKGAITLSGGGNSSSTGYSSLSTSAGYYNGSTYDDTDIITLSSIKTNGYYELETSGYGSITRAAINATISTAGYMPLNDVTTATATTLTSNTGTTKYYIKKSTHTALSVNSSNTAQTITISDGYYPTDRTITINAMPTKTPTTSYSNSNMSTYFNAGTSSDYNVSITPQYSNDAGYVDAHNNTNNGGIGYWKIKTTSVSQGTTTVSDTIATRGNTSWGTGWISSGNISAATFANSATSGVTYVDISATTAAPVLVSGNYLYINKGYTDNLKISLAKLVPDGASATLAAGHILSGYSAYNNDGTLIAGNIPSKDSSNLTQNGNTVTAAAGYYAENATLTIGAGSYSVNNTQNNAGSVTPTLTINNVTATDYATYGISTTAPSSGTSGVHYYAFNSGATVSKWKATATATINAAGYIATGSKTKELEGTPTIINGNSLYIPIVTTSVSGGELTVTNYSATPTLTLGAASNTYTNMANIAITSTESSEYPYWYKVTAGTDSLSGTTTVSRAAITYSNSAGLIEAHNNTQAIASNSSSPTVTIGSTSNTKWIGLKQASMTVSGVNTTSNIAPMVAFGSSHANVELWNTNNGVYLPITGGINASSITAKATTNVAGYAPASTDLGDATINIAAKQTTSGSYIKGVTLRPSGDNNVVNTFYINVPNGSVDANNTITFVFSVYNDGSVTVAGPD